MRNVADGDSSEPEAGRGDYAINCGEPRDNEVGGGPKTLMPPSTCAGAPAIRLAPPAFRKCAATT